MLKKMFRTVQTAFSRRLTQTDQMHFWAGFSKVEVYCKDILFHVVWQYTIHPNNTKQWMCSMTVKLAPMYINS